VRVAAAHLASAVEDVVRVVDIEFLHRGGSVEELLAAYAEAHHYRRVSEG
jgi:hypothetical protein